MRKPGIDVSFVMTVFNKEYYLPSVLKALLGQTGIKNPEYIFVDDVSHDRSVDIIRKATKNIPNVTIIVNKTRMGISPNTNKALKLAKGKYVRMLDSDDILPINSTEKMVALAELHNADIVYGCFEKTGLEPEKLTNRMMGDFKYTYCKDALEGLLNGRFIRMGQLISNHVLQKAKGADERVFIQDQSLPLRAAIHAHGIIKIAENAVLIPKEIGNFSGNKLQLDHDRFLAYAYALTDNPALPLKCRLKMQRRAFSAYWKMVRKTRTFPYFDKGLKFYLWSRIAQSIDLQTLEAMRQEFLALPGVRRIGDK